MKWLQTIRIANHKLNIADIMTLLRIAGTMLLVFLCPLSTGFFFAYVCTGVTDVLDGWIARRTKTASDFGARLDSAADLWFYSVVLIRIFPVLWSTLPVDIWYAVMIVIIVRILAYLVAAIKYHRFASLHTYLNKLTGASVFLIPFLLVTPYSIVYCQITCIVAAAASLEELAVHLQRKTYRVGTKSIFQK